MTRTTLGALAAGLALLTPVARAPQAQLPTTVVYRFTPTVDAPSAVDPTPRVDLGESGAPAELFSRIAIVRRQSSGQIVVGNRNPPELRVFDANGKYVRTIGRKGAGPGEYLDINDVVIRRGDSLVVLDRWQRRITFLAPNGGVVSTMGFQQPFPTSPYDVSVNALDDGSVLIGYGLVTVTRPTPEPVSVSQIVGRYTTTGTRLDSIGAFYTGENFLQAASPTHGGFAFWDRTFGRKGAIISTGTSFMAGDASAMEVRRYSTKGALLEIHRVDVARKPVTPSDIARYKRDEMSTVKADEREVEQKRVDDMPYPAQFPAYSRYMVDARGRIWMQEYVYPAYDNRWMVLDPKTRQAKTVRLPGRFIPFDIGATDIAGVWRDQDDVEHVRVYKLVD